MRGFGISDSGVLRLRVEECPAGGHQIGLAFGEQSNAIRVNVDLRSLASQLCLPSCISKLLTRLATTLAGPIHLSFDGRAEVGIPWEKVSAPAFGALALHPMFRVSRYVEQPSRKAESVKGAPRLLLVCANPHGSQGVLGGLNAEMRSVVQALSGPDCRHVTVETLRYANRSSLRAAIEEFRPHIFHFMGHAVTRASGKALLLHGGGEQGDSYLHLDELAGWLGQSQVKLVALFACGTADYKSASSFLQNGAVGYLGMSRPWMDSASAPFARAFYAALAEGCSLDDAVYHGRQATSSMADEWSVPVLFTGGAPNRPFLERNGEPSDDLVMDVYTHLGRLYAAIAQPAEAQEFIRDVVARAYRSGKFSELAWLLMDMGSAAEKGGDLNQAAASYVAARKIDGALATNLRDKATEKLSHFSSSHPELGSVISQVTGQNWRSLITKIVSR